MKRKAISGIVLMLLLTSMLSSAFVIQPVKAAGGTIYIRADGSVDPDASIQRDGDLYTFTDNIYDSIVVERDNIVVDGAGYTVQGIGSGKGIDLRDRRNVTVMNTNIKAFGYGIFLWDSYNNVIRDNTVSNNSKGIILHGSSNTISSNRVTNNSDTGIELAVASYNTISDNTITHNGLGGINLGSSGYNTLSGNTMVSNGYNFGVHGHPVSAFTNYVDTSNTVDGKPIYYWVNEQEKIVPADAGCVIIVKSINITVEDLNLTGNMAGVLLAYTQNSLVQNVTSENNHYYGIELYGSNNNTLIGNTVANNAIGIYLKSSSWDVLSGNIVTNNSDEGIAIHTSSGNTIYDNSIVENGYGGISPIYYRGIWLYESSDNKIYHNNFIRNTAQVYVTAGYTNVWDDGYPSGGNYWSDYEERYPDAGELDDSGIWNTPYVIDENNQDNYPLMNPWTPTPTLIPGKDVPVEAPDFFTSVLTKLNIPTSQFAVQALTIWTNYENTNAYWNPLATTWDMGEKSWNFNEAGVQNYADKETGIQATANTLALHYYESIREMLAIQSFNEQQLREAVATWSGLNSNNPYVVNLVNEWRKIYPVSADQPPTCVIKLQKDGVEIDQVDVGEFFDIYVGDSIDDIGIEQVRFSSDDVQDAIATGQWTEWYDWHVSSGDWNASTKIKRWAFATGGYKEVWADVKDDIGQTAISSADVYANLPDQALPVITSPLVIAPIKDIYWVGDSLTAEFTIKNIGEMPITVDVLAVGGRLNGWCPAEGCPDFTHRYVTLQSSESYQYSGSLTLTQTGNYHFFVAYHIENPTAEEKRLLDENNWNTCVQVGEGLTHADRVKNLIVLEEGTVPEEVSELKDKIGRLKRQHIVYPPYLLDVDSFTSAVATLWADFTSFVTRTDLTKIYDELYYTGIDYDCLRFKALVDADRSLEMGDIEGAKKYLQKSYMYDRLSAMSFGAAAEVFEGNLEAGVTLAKGIKDGCEASVKLGLKVINPTAAKAADYIYIGVDYVVDRMLVGEEQAARNAVIRTAVTAIFNEIKFADFGGRTIADYTNNRIGKITFPIMQKAFQNNEQLQWALSKVLKAYLGMRAEEVAAGIVDELCTAIDSLQSIAESPVELRVYDSQGNATGLFSGEVRHGISRSVYWDGTVTIFFPSDSYHYEVLGKNEGTYGLTVTFVENGEATTFNANDIPTSANATHQYTVDWDALCRGEEGVTVQLDSEGDGIFELTFTSNGELSHSEYVAATYAINTWITDSDFNEIESFRAVFTPYGDTELYKLTVTNPGQFYFNILVNNTWPEPLNMTIFYSIDLNFTLKGAKPIHVYADLERTVDITANCTFSDNTIIVYNVDPNTIIYVTIHLDYALKGTTWTAEEVEAWYSEHGFSATVRSITSKVVITDPELQIPPIPLSLIFLMDVLPAIILCLGIFIALLKYVMLPTKKRK